MIEFFESFDSFRVLPLPCFLRRSSRRGFTVSAKPGVASLALAPLAPFLFLDAQSPAVRQRVRSYARRSSSLDSRDEAHEAA